MPHRVRAQRVAVAAVRVVERAEFHRRAHLVEGHREDIGRHLLAHFCPFVVIDTNGRVPGLVGAYIDGLMPKYFKGPQRPRLGDLAYTEAALFGM